MTSVAEEIVKDVDSFFSEEEKKGAHPVLLRMVREIHKLGSVLQLLKAAEVPDSFSTRGAILIPDADNAAGAVQLSGYKANRSTIVISNTGANAIKIMNGETFDQRQAFTVLGGGVQEIECKEAVWACIATASQTSTVDILETLYGKRR